MFDKREEGGKRESKKEDTQWLSEAEVRMTSGSPTFWWAPTVTWQVFRENHQYYVNYFEQLGGSNSLRWKNAKQPSQKSITSSPCTAMVNYYDELEIEDFSWDPVARVFHYPCPCGDRFEISKAQLRDGEEIATCPSCSLIVRVIYDYVSDTDTIIASALLTHCSSTGRTM
jgi:diphthamide biosynthesis protein 3